MWCSGSQPRRGDVHYRVVAHDVGPHVVEGGGVHRPQGGVVDARAVYRGQLDAPVVRNVHCSPVRVVIARVRGIGVRPVGSVMPSGLTSANFHASPKATDLLPAAVIGAASAPAVRPVMPRTGASAAAPKPVWRGAAPGGAMARQIHALARPIQQNPGSADLRTASYLRLDPWLPPFPQDQTILAVPGRNRT